MAGELVARLESLMGVVGGGEDTNDSEDDDDE